MKQAAEVLQSFPEWQNDWQSHALFCAYDQDSSEEFVLSFWKRAVHRLFQESIAGLSIDFEELKRMTHRNGRYPTGLHDILAELVKRNEFTVPEKVQNCLQDKQNSQYWTYWLKKNIVGVTQVEFNVKRLVDPLKLNLFAEKLQNFSRENERNVFTLDELAKYLKVNDQDLQILIDFMKIEEKAIQFSEDQGKNRVDFVKIQVEGAKLSLKPEDSAIIQLNLTMNDIDRKVKELNENAEEVHSKIMAELKMQNRNNAKFLLMRKKMILKKVEDLLGSRISIEQQLLSIKNSVTNKEIVNALKSSNQILKNIMPDIDEVNQVLDSAKENIEILNEVSFGLAGKDQEDELLDQFEALGIEEAPKVPEYKIQEKMKKPDQIDLEKEFDELEVGNILVN